MLQRVAFTTSCTPNPWIAEAVHAAGSGLHRKLHAGNLVESRHAAGTAKPASLHSQATLQAYQAAGQHICTDTAHTLASSTQLQFRR